MVVASLSLATVPAEDVGRSRPGPTNAYSGGLTEEANWRLVEPRRSPTESEAWEKFRAEYRPQQPNALPIKRPIESAKYGLDVATYNFDRFVKNVNNDMDFKFDHGLRHVSPEDLSTPRTTRNPWTDGLKNIHIKLELMPQVGQPYAGVRVTIPFGN